MTAYLLRRIASSLLLVLLLVSLLFFLLHLAPGDPAELIADPRMPPEQHERLVHLYGLDRPLGEQYLTWLSAVVLHWDWGTSFIHHRPAARVLAEALPATLLLATTALVIDTTLGLLLGIVSARRRERAADHLIRGVSLLVYSMPTFWLALMAVLLFAYRWPLLPVSHMHSPGADDLPWAARQADLLWHLALPAVVLGVSSCGATIRLLRANLLEALGQDYVRTARAKGLSERRVVLVHALRNAVVPLIQALGFNFPALLNGSLVVEVIFSWPGVGRLLFTALNTNDYPLVLAGTALAGTMVVAGNLLADLLHALVDPRLRVG